MPPCPPPADFGIETSPPPCIHYSLLASIEEFFRVPKLGYGSTDRDRFGLDVYNSGWKN